MSIALDYAPNPRSTPARGARSALVLLLLINLFNYIDRYVLSAVLPRIQAQFFPTNPPNTKLLMGLLATAFMVTYMVASPVFGWLADRMSRWVIVGLSVLVWSLATGGSGLAALVGGFWLLLATRCFVGIGEAGYGPAAPTLISDLYPVERRGAVLAWFYMAIPVGSAMGFVIGGQIAEHFHWQWAFYAVVIPGLIFGVWSLWMPDPPRGQSDAIAGGHGSGGSLRTASLRDYGVLLRTPSYVLDCLGMAAMTFAIGGISFWMPTYLVSRHVGSLASINTIFGGIVVVGGLTATLLGGIAGDRLRRRFPSSYFLVSGIGIIVAAPFVLLILRTSGMWMWSWMFLAVFFLFFNTGPSNTILANVTHPSVRATGFAMNIFLIHILGDATAAPILGKIGQQSWDAAFVVVAAVMVLAGVLWLWGCRYLERDTAMAPTRL
jgi:MFS family permease